MFTNSWDLSKTETTKMCGYGWGETYPTVDRSQERWNVLRRDDRKTVFRHGLPENQKNDKSHGGFWLKTKRVALN